jgi:hypothetical protein
MTLSNEEGSFFLPLVTPTDTLIFSHISYGEQRIAATEVFGDTVRLKARDFTLDEVAIVSETEEAILRKVIKAISKNHDFNHTPYFSQSWKAISSLDRSILHAFFELDGFILHRNFIPNREFAEIQTRARSLTPLGRAWLENTPIYANHWLYFYVGGTYEENVLDRPQRANDFDVKIMGIHQEEGYTVMGLELTPKRLTCNLRYTLHIDVESYAVMRFKAQPRFVKYSYQGECEIYEDYEYEERFVEIDKVWHRLYLKQTNRCSFQDQVVLKEEFNYAQLADWDNSKQESALPFSSGILGNPVTTFQISWDHPYWQSRRSVPLPKWIVEHLESKKMRP